MTETVLKHIQTRPNVHFSGHVLSMNTLMIQATCPFRFVSIGQECSIHSHQDTITGEVVAFENNIAHIMPYGNIECISPGACVDYTRERAHIYPDTSWLGRTLNGLGEPCDDRGLLPMGATAIPLRRNPPSAHQRQQVEHPIDVGVKAINTFTTVCRGQRMGIFAGSGVGKSMLLSMLARFTACDVCVIGLIGERGREVRDFIENTLGAEGLKKSVLVVATSDESPLLRRRAAYLTMAIAEYFRDLGKSVLCLFDSVTRLAMAQREIGLSAGEPPTTKGYTPSVFVELARVMERAGPGTSTGTITAFFTVLVDGDDHNEPISDAARGILDGHLVLDRAIAERGHYPAIHILKSLSRMVPRCHTKKEQALVRQARQTLATYEDMADLIRLGAYRKGSDPDVDRAIQLYPALQHLLQQDVQVSCSLENSFQLLEQALACGSDASRENTS